MTDRERALEAMPNPFDKTKDHETLSDFRNEALKWIGEHYFTIRAALQQPEPTKTVAEFMIKESFATGHGDTLNDLLTELSWQIKELREKTRPEVVTVEELDELFLDLDQAEAMMRRYLNGVKIVEKKE